MGDRVLIFYGSYRSDRQGIRLADWLVRTLAERGASAELIDAKALDLPMLDRMYKEYPKGEAPPAMEALAEKIRTADAFVFVTGEYNWGVQPGLKNLTDHFLEEWYWRPCRDRQLLRRALRRRPRRAGLARHPCPRWEWWSSRARSPWDRSGTPSMPRANRPGTVVLRSFRALPRFADDLAWWTEAARAQRGRAAPPY